ncbi:MAG: hypothetical protein MUE53_06755 [Chitinophagales bacterium]|jgi:lipoate-protein ligase A|nr:hypothetical protein [Chitinophagales bacterium]
MGRNQNLFQEVNLDSLSKIPVYRRLTGGGTVYHDLGVINFAYIGPKTFESVNSYLYSTQVMVNFLQSCNINAMMNERAGVYVNDFKILGSAQFASKSKLISHFSLLFDADLDILSFCLKPNTFKIEHKNTLSVRSRVMNLSSILPISKETFISNFRNFASYNQDFEMTSELFHRAQMLQLEKYRNKSWRYNDTINCTLKKDLHFLKFETGKITATSKDMEDLQNKSLIDFLDNSSYLDRIR